MPIKSSSYISQNPTAEGEATRSRVVRAAIELFAERGYHSTGIRELSERANIGRGALYYHIRSKQELLFDITMTFLEDQAHNARLVVESDLDPLAKLRLLTHQGVNGLTNDRQGFRVVIWESRALEGEYKAKVADLRKSYHGHWTVALDEAAKQGLLKPADASIVWGFIGMINYTIRWLEPDGPDSPEAVADRYYDFLIGGLAA